MREPSLHDRVNWDHRVLKREPAAQRVAETLASARRCAQWELDGFPYHATDEVLHQVEIGTARVTN